MIQVTKTHTHRFLSLLFATSLILLVCAGAWAEKGIAVQTGLPEELTIDTSFDLKAQIEALTKMVEWSAEHHPKKKVGLIAGLTSMFTASDKDQVVTTSDIKDRLADLQEQRVVVTGMYSVVDDKAGTITAGGVTIPVSISGGVEPEGFVDYTFGPLPAVITGIVESTDDNPPAGTIRATKIEPSGWLAQFRIARCHEIDGDFEKAVEAYQAAGHKATESGSLLSSFGLVRGAELALNQLKDEKRAKNLYNEVWNSCGKLDKDGKCAYTIWEFDGNAWALVPLREQVGPVLDELSKDNFWYGVVDLFVKIAGGNPALGVILIAIVMRLMIWPLTKKQLQSAKAMQDLQPETKALQEKYVDDKQKFQEEFWKLCQERGVNPLGGCLPMLVQFPILIFLYRGIREYIWHFENASFLWVDNLAAPDMILLVAYTISMIFFQKMTQKTQASAAMNPQQQQQQQMMTYMMPIMFFFFFQSFPAAFLLYWLASNIIYFGEQYLHTHTQTPVVDGAGNGKATGFVGSMVTMLTSGDEKKDDNADAPVERKSYADRVAESSGKKTHRDTGKTSKRK